MLPTPLVDFETILAGLSEASLLSFRIEVYPSPSLSKIGGKPSPPLVALTFFSRERQDGLSPSFSYGEKRSSVVFLFFFFPFTEALLRVLPFFGTIKFTTSFLKKAVPSPFL